MKKRNRNRTSRPQKEYSSKAIFKQRNYGDNPPYFPLFFDLSFIHRQGEKEEENHRSIISYSLHFSIYIHNEENSTYKSKSPCSLLFSPFSEPDRARPDQTRPDPNFSLLVLYFPTTMATPDLLFGLRNNFYLGAYQAAINSGEISNLSAEDAVERDSLVYRSYIALGSYQLVINEIDSSAPTALQAVKLLALYLSGPQDKESAITSLKELLGDAAIGSNPTLRLIAGIIFTHEQDYNEALKHTHSGGTMELHALNVQIYIKMNRSDHAEKQLKIMQQADEDHALTQLANAWVDLAVGGSKIQEAYLIFQDFSEKYPMTCLVLNGKALCCMHMGNFDEAESLLIEALNKDAKDSETLANLVVCSLHVGKSSARFLNQLKLSHPDHLLVKRMASAEESFERAIQSIA
ncbi:hypothetical protein LUZ60_002968 [Juncus effusus]|nr:hypothetical protein LUZ60_002968 [Juncus effusus]